jgi:hypothetical protein
LKELGGVAWSSEEAFSLCSSRDPRATAALHFTAEAGETYFFGTKYIIQDGLILFDPLDSDEAKLLIASFALATSHVK